MRRRFYKLYSYYRWLFWQNDGYLSDSDRKEFRETIICCRWSCEEDLIRILEYFGV